MAAGARIFRERGYAGTTMRLVADEAGLKAGSLYYHFHSKDELVAAVLETGVRSVWTRVSHAIAALPPSSSYVDRLQAAVHSHFSAVVDYEDYSLASRRVFGQVPADVRRRYAKQRNEYGQLWFELLNAAREAGEIRADIDIKLTYWFIIGALNSSAEWYHPGENSLDDIADQFLKLIIGGLESAPIKARMVAKRQAK